LIQARDHSTAGVLSSHGQTWEEQRRFTLKTLRDLGFGKNNNEELVTEEVISLLACP
jgi:hypothetical protein